MKTEVIIAEVLTHTILWGSVLFFLILHKRLDRSYKLLALSAIVDASLTAVGTLFLINKTNNLFVKHFAMHEQVLFICAAFFFLFKDARFRTGLIVLGCFYFLFSLFDTIFYESLKMAPSNIIVVGSLLLIFCSFFLFYEIFREGKVLYLENYPHFWLGASVLIYYGATIFISLFLNILTYELPVWMYNFFYFIDLFLFFLSKVALLFGAYLLSRNGSQNISRTPSLNLKTNRV